MAYTMDLYMVVTHLLTGMILTKWVAGLLSDLSGWKARSDVLLSPKKKVENNPDFLTPKEETWKNHPGFYCLERSSFWVAPPIFVRTNRKQTYLKIERSKLEYNKRFFQPSCLVSKSNF